MTRDDLVAQLAAIERHLAAHVTITRVIKDEDGRELRRASTTRRRKSGDDVSITIVRRIVRLQPKEFQS